MKKLYKTKHQISRAPKRVQGVDVSVTYTGDIDIDKDKALRKVLGTNSTGSGFLFIGDGTRDHSARVPAAELDRILKDLKKIDGVKVSAPRAN